jgi:hypothetical protein
VNGVGVSRVGADINRAAEQRANHSRSESKLRVLGGLGRGTRKRTLCPVISLNMEGGKGEVAFNPVSAHRL